MKSKKLRVSLVIITALVLVLHFIPMYSKTITACAAKPLTKSGRYILGASKSSIDKQADSIKEFNKNIDCPVNTITFKLYLL